MQKRVSAAEAISRIKDGDVLGYPNQGLGRLLLKDRIKRVIGSFFTPNKDVARYYTEGKLEVTLLPQGTLAEAIRAKVEADYDLAPDLKSMAL